MNLFFNTTELLVFIILAIPFVGLIFTAIAILYSDAFVQAHTSLARKMFTGKSKKLGRVAIVAIAIIVSQMYHWLMVETLLIGYLAWHFAMLAFFHNKVTLNLSARKF